jgi:hypothetical protein
MQNIEEFGFVSIVKRGHLLLSIFWPIFLIKFSENPKNSEKQWKSKKKYVFNIFASFLAFSTSSKKEFKFSNVFRTRSIFHASFLKALIFLIESTLILLVFKKIEEKTRKIKIYKKKVKGPILRPKQHFIYKYGSTTHIRGGGNFETLKKNHKKKP